MQLSTTFEDLVSKASEYDLYTKLIKQLNKDFALANIDLNFEEDILPSSLKYVLHETLYNLIQTKFIDYLNLLYIIDVSEEKIKQLDSYDTLELSEKVTFLILQREWQKVWYKSQYS